MSSLPGEPLYAEAAATPVPSSTTTTDADVAATQPGDSAPVASTSGELTGNDKAQAAGTDEKGAPVFDMAGGASSASKKKRKARKKPLHERGETALNRYRGTGFEEYYADPPLTANEHWDEQNNIYTSDRSFEDRIEECIQRFRARRRMDNERNAYFTKYLMLGGIDSVQRQFTGNEEPLQRKKKKKDDSDDEGEELDVTHNTSNQLSTDQHNSLRKGDRVRAEANDVISRNTEVSRYYSPGAKGWVKGDFEGVVAGFLCSKFMDDSGPKVGSMDIAIDTVVSFLRYVLQHDVCPEYEESVNKALAVCERAKIELPLCAAVYFGSPGDFNSAARILYCTDGKCDDYMVDSTEPMVIYREQGKEHWEFEDSILVPRGFDAKRVFMSTIALQGGDGLATRLHKSKSVTVTATYVQDYEVVDPKTDPRVLRNVIRPDEKMKETSARIKDKSGKRGTIKPVGIVVLKPCVIEDGWDNHTAKVDEGSQLQHLFLDDDILQLLRVGMKLRLVVSELSIGMKFIKQVLDVLPSFYTFLLQELMLDYKEPKPNERPPPSVDDPDVEYRALEEMALKDIEE